MAESGQESEPSRQLNDQLLQLRREQARKFQAERSAGRPPVSRSAMQASHHPAYSAPPDVTVAPRVRVSTRREASPGIPRPVRREQSPITVSPSPPVQQEPFRRRPLDEDELRQIREDEELARRLAGEDGVCNVAALLFCCSRTHFIVSSSVRSTH